MVLEIETLPPEFHGEGGVKLGIIGANGKGGKGTFGNGGKLGSGGRLGMSNGGGNGNGGSCGNGIPGICGNGIPGIPGGNGKIFISLVAVLFILSKFFSFPISSSGLSFIELSIKSRASTRLATTLNKTMKLQTILEHFLEAFMAMDKGFSFS
ncbi:hypothetical protein JCGZ_09166 [Jatropha curcas]|uniref:Uncharacterized protein n=1 Tax=Jatropha curcas TaxID=180498 RepID=A0A067KIP5_JATCU|nr:hypothetical protein JCGZ_09166 [Jatropha curcas]